LAGWFSAASAQETDRLTARQLFYTTQVEKAPPAKKAAPAPAPAPKKTTPTPAPDSSKKQPPPPPQQPAPAAPFLGLRYSILQLQGDKLQEVDPEKTFHSGDRVQLRIESNDSGYLYLILQGSMGDWKVLFPSKEIRNGDNLLRARTAIQIPGGEDRDFRFDPDPGTEKIFVVLSREPEGELDSLIYTIQRQNARHVEVAVANPPAMPFRDTLAGNDFNPVRSRLEARGMDLSRRQTANSAGEKAVYIVNASASSTGQVVATIVLKHE